MITLNYNEENDSCRYNLDYSSVDFVIVRRDIDLGWAQSNHSNLLKPRRGHGQLSVSG